MAVPVGSASLYPPYTSQIAEGCAEGRSPLCRESEGVPQSFPFLPSPPRSKIRLRRSGGQGVDKSPSAASHGLTSG